MPIHRQPDAAETAETGSRPGVSVCMPAHRDSALFTAALQSALAQEYKDLEVVITDDSGGDLRAAAEAADDPRIRYIANPEPLGFAGNHCRAIACSTGQFIAFLHDDDIWHPAYLAQAVAALEHDRTLGMVITGATEIDEDGAFLNERPTEFTAGRQADSLASVLHRREMMLLPSATVVRQKALSDNVLPWPDVIAADMTMYVDIARAGWGLFHLPEPLIQYRMHTGQIGYDNYAHRHALVTVWDRYEFSGPHEQVRRSRLAGALIGRAGAAVRAGAGAQARRDLARAIRLERGILLTPRAGAVLALSLLPTGLVAWVHRQWSKVHDPVGTRHQGT